MSRHASPPFRGIGQFHADCGMHICYCLIMNDAIKAWPETAWLKHGRYGGVIMVFRTLGTILGTQGHFVLVFLIDGCKYYRQQSLLQCKLHAHALQGS